LANGVEEVLSRQSETETRQQREENDLGNEQFALVRMEKGRSVANPPWCQRHGRVRTRAVHSPSENAPLEEREPTDIGCGEGPYETLVLSQVPPCGSGNQFRDLIIVPSASSIESKRSLASINNTLRFQGGLFAKLELFFQ